MAFTGDITLNDGTNNTVYAEISRNGTETLRRVSVRGLTYPKTMRIAHQSVKAAVGGKANRVLVRIDDISNVNAGDPASKAGECVYLVIQKPESLPNPDKVQAMVAELKGFLTPANVSKLLAGES